MMTKSDEQIIPTVLKLSIKSENYLPGGNDEERDYKGTSVYGQCAHCEKPPDYIVTIYSEKEYLEDDNEYHQQKLGLQFCCREHFDAYYRNIPIMPQTVLPWMHGWTFATITTWLKRKEKSNKKE